MAPALILPVHTLFPGAASGSVLWSDEPLSFWGGIDPATGEVIDRQHPLRGQGVRGRILCLPSGKGSCTGSLALLEMIVAGVAPAAVIVREDETILPVGALAAELFFGRTLPIARVAAEAFAALAQGGMAHLGDGRIALGAAWPDGAALSVAAASESRSAPPFELTAADEACLSGAQGEAAALALDAIVRIGRLMGADRLIDVTQVHVDACIHTGPAVLAVAEKLAAMGARFVVPTTLNAISVDRRRWRELGCDPASGEPAERLAELYAGMGAARSYTCAPYLLAGRPGAGDMVAWGESNAVVYANSVLGARTLKTPDLLDIFIALTGRAPCAGPYREEGRRPGLAVEVSVPDGIDDSFYPALGHLAGALAGPDIPLLRGLAACHPTPDDLKAFGAAFATTSSAPMFQIVGVTPAAEVAGIPTLRIARDQLAETFGALDASEAEAIDVVALGNPHLSLDEIRRIAELCAGRQAHASTRLALTCGRDIATQAEEAGLLDPIRAFGGLILNDTCWCMLGEPVIPPSARTIMTNSGKYAHYGPGLTGRGFRFGSLAACIDAAATGRATKALPAWLR